MHNFQAQDRIIINAMETIFAIDEVCGELFLPHQPGLYLNGSREPVLLFDGSRQYVKLVQGENNTLIKQPVTCLNDVYDAGHIYDPQGNIVLQVDVVRRRNFSDKPSVPYRFLELLRTIAIEKIRSLCYWNKSAKTSTRECINALLLPVYHDNPALYDSIHELIWPFERQVMAYVSDNIYNYYTVDMIGTDIAINRGEDFRILEWHRNEGVKFVPKKR